MASERTGAASSSVCRAFTATMRKEFFPNGQFCCLVRDVPETTSKLRLWWLIPKLLAGMPMPHVHLNRRLNKGGPLVAHEDDLPLLHAEGIRAVVCLLNIPTDEPVYQTAGFEFMCVPVPDTAPPLVAQALDFVVFVDACHARRQPVVVHCEGGMSRTATMLATYLIAQGDDAATALDKVRAVEPRPSETLRQIGFLSEFEREISSKRDQR
jgi:atypical dual specificity phosphatase